MARILPAAASIHRIQSAGCRLLLGLLLRVGGHRLGVGDDFADPNRGVDAFWHGLVEGRSGVSDVTRFDASQFRCQLAAEVDNECLPNWEGPHRHELKRMAPFVQYGLTAGLDALEMAGLSPNHFEPMEGGFFVGVGMGGLDAIEAGIARQESQGWRRTNPFLIPSLVPNMAAAVLGLALDSPAQQVTFASGCAAALQAVGHGIAAIRSGQSRWILAGGAESVMTPIAFSGLHAMGYLSAATNGATPCPFDRQRNGTIVGEGAAMIVLEDLESATARGAEVIAEVAAYGTSSGRERAFFPSEGAIVASASQALRSGLQSVVPDAVYAFAAGLAADEVELDAIRRFAQVSDRRPLVTSTKGHLGYAFAAAGAMDVVAAALSLRNQLLPATLNLVDPAPQYEEMLVRRTQPEDMNSILVEAFGLGGVNASLLLNQF